MVSEALSMEIGRGNEVTPKTQDDRHMFTALFWGMNSVHNWGMNSVAATFSQDDFWTAIPRVAIGYLKKSPA